MKAQYLRYKKQWTAFTTLSGIDIQEYGETEREARQKLAYRISKSSFLMNGITIPNLLS
jgi:hypothetical protein